MDDSTLTVPTRAASAFRRLPEAIVNDGTAPGRSRPRLLTPVYGSLRRAFSGTTFYLAQTAMRDGVLDGAFTLNTETDRDPRLMVSGAVWKIARFLSGRKSGGFKFASLFHDTLWKQHIGRLEGTMIVNNFQLFGDVFLRRHAELGITPCFYIDGTLTEYFHTYGQVEDHTIGTDMVRRAIDLERESYQSAEHIFTMSRATMRNLIDVYGVAETRVTVVIPGANLSDVSIPPPSAHTGWVGDVFTLGFVGLFPLRKGLDKLADAVEILRDRGLPVRLRVIGRCPEAIAAMDGVEFLGTIDKTMQAGRFVDALKSCDLGCQMSRAELLGIAVMEFLRLGIPVLATAVGGVPDVLEGGGGLLVAADVTVEQLAHEIQSLMTDGARYQVIREAAIERRDWATWTRAVREIDLPLSRLD